jgi:hypothetical protein
VRSLCGLRSLCHVSWRFWRPQESEAEQTLDGLEQQSAVAVTPGPTAADPAATADPYAGLGILLTVAATPIAKAPGSPISVVNEQEPVRLDDKAQLVTFARTQETTIVSITRGGVPVQVLEYGEHADIVLEPGTDLGEVYRTSCLQDPDSDDDWPEGWFSLQVQAFEPRGIDLFVVGPARGRITEGRRVTFQPAQGEEDRTAKIKSIELQPDGRWGLLLDDTPAQGIEYGDELLHVRI